MVKISFFRAKAEDCISKSSLWGASSFHFPKHHFSLS